MGFPDGGLYPTVPSDQVPRPVRPDGGERVTAHPDKEDVLILDLSSNCTYHGDPNSPSVKIPNMTNHGSSAPTKVCPECQTIHFAGVKECDVCGYIFITYVQIDNTPKHMRDVRWDKEEAPIVVDVETKSSNDYISRAGNRILKLRMKCRERGALIPIFVNHFFDFEGNGSGWGRERARKLWRDIAQTEPPETVKEAKHREEELFFGIPCRIEVKKNKNWWNVEFWGVKPWNWAKEEELHGAIDEIPF